MNEVNSEYESEVEIIEKREVKEVKPKFRKGLKIGTTAISREIIQPKP